MRPSAAPLLLLLLLLAGCSSPPAGQGDAAQVPVWHVGDFWHYESVADNAWINWTVKEQKKQFGFDTYEVLEETSGPVVGERGALGWVDVQTLGFVGESDLKRDVSASCPIDRIFPLEPQQYACVVTEQGSSFTVNTTTHPTGWGWQLVPAGNFSAVTIHYDAQSFSPASNGSGRALPPDIQFAPAVGNRLFTPGQVVSVDSAGKRHIRPASFALAAWGNAPT